MRLLHCEKTRRAFVNMREMCEPRRVLSTFLEHGSQMSGVFSHCVIHGPDFFWLAEHKLEREQQNPSFVDFFCSRSNLHMARMRKKPASRRRLYLVQFQISSGPHSISVQKKNIWVLALMWIHYSLLTEKSLFLFCVLDFPLFSCVWCLYF